MPKYARHILAVLMVFSVAACAQIPFLKLSKSGKIHSWAAYYGDKVPAETFRAYDLVVFDRRHHPDLASLKGNSLVLAYVSAGEVHDDVPEKARLEEEKLLLFKNKRWNSHAVDLTSAMWQDMVLDQVDDAMKKGFDGVMLDTLDSPLHWARTQDPDRLEAMLSAAEELVKTIRSSHPNIIIMVNRGFEILPRVASDINFILAESILVNANDSTGQFQLFSPNTYSQAVTELHRITARTPDVQILTLDYWSMDDVSGLEKIYAQQRAEGFVPYVSTHDLVTFTPEPLRRKRKR